MVEIVAWRWRRGIPFLAVMSLLSACSGTPAETTAAPTSAVTTTSAATTTTPPATTTPTTTTSSTTTTTVPLNVEPIEGVPDELVALIGAPMPEFDRTIAANEDGTANVEDVQRWLDEWDAWSTWMDANRPTTGTEVLDFIYAPGSEVFVAVGDAIADDPETFYLSPPDQPIYVDDTSDVGSGFSENRSLRLTFSLGNQHLFKVSDWSLIEEIGPITTVPTASFLLLADTLDSGAVIWRIADFEFLG